MRYDFQKPAMLILFTLVLFACNNLAHGKGIEFRHHGGFGYLRSSETDLSSSVFHIGGRVMLHANDHRKYGLEATYFSLTNGNAHTAIGIILENKIGAWFTMSIGTVGYFHYANTRDNPVGLTTNLGWESQKFKKINPFITYRNDFIFHDRPAITQSLSVGFRW